MRRFCCLLFLLASSLYSQTPQQPAVVRTGDYEVSLRLPIAGLFAREEMEIELHVADVTRPDPLTGYAPVIRAVIETRIDMPEMPGMPVYREQAHAEGVPGDYGVHPTFAHGGAYRLRFTVKPPIGAAFDGEFPLAVADEAEGRKRKAALPPRYTIELSLNPKRPKAGESAELRFVIRDRENPKAVFNSFEVVHETLFHLIIVRSDLAHFAHEHPEKQPDGSFVLRYRFAAGGEYRLFADVAPAGAGSQILSVKASIGGSEGERFRITAAEKAAARTIENVAFSLTDAKVLPAKKTVSIPVRIESAGQPVSDLEPYLGVQGHFLLVHEDGATFVHSHPSEGETTPGTLRFLARFPKDGLYRGWVQVKRNGRILTADFVLQAGLAQ
jgi:hypothetical protein